jgi:hypothetical protein
MAAEEDASERGWGGHRRLLYLVLLALWILSSAFSLTSTRSWASFLQPLEGTETSRHVNDNFDIIDDDDDDLLLPARGDLPVGGDMVTDTTSTSRPTSAPSLAPSPRESCAIILYGLPRAFGSLVLPSLVQHVLEPNAGYHCDYFVHYYNLTQEAAGRSGKGGSLNPHEIRSLTGAVQEVARRWATTSNSSSGTIEPPTIAYGMTQEADFWTEQAEFLVKVHTTKDSRGRLLYYPWEEQSYTAATVDNIVKMWYSIQSAWQVMESHAAQHAVNYARVAMLRSDVFYMTPVDIWQRGGGVGKTARDMDNRVVVIPDFANFPVSDRMIYGPYEAVRLWSATRFDSLDAHAQWSLQHKPGCTMHSESFVSRLVTRIQERGFVVDRHETLCFFRVRVDESVWVSDCTMPVPYASPKIRAGLPTDLQAEVEAILGRSCVGNIYKVSSGSSGIRCPRGATNASGVDLSGI